MKKTLTIGLAAAAISAALPTVITNGSERDRIAGADALPAYEILSSVRSMGLNPAGEPVRRGQYYVLHAFEPTGAEVRVVADAQFGDVVSVTPAALSQAYVPPYRRGARIIQVPQPGDRDDDTASIDGNDAPVLSNDDEAGDYAPPPRRRAAPANPRVQAKPSTHATKPHTKPAVHAKPKIEAKPVTEASVPRNVPRWRLRSDSPPPPPPTGPRRAVLSAPPPSIAGPTPLRPTPKFDARPAADSKANTGEKFANPATAAVTEAVTENDPPRGYTPPATPLAKPAAVPAQSKPPAAAATPPAQHEADDGFGDQ